MRTEKEVLNDFEKLGWKLADKLPNFVLHKRKITQCEDNEITHYCYIRINKEKQTYGVEDNYYFHPYYYRLTMQEHKLLTDLFKIWRWL